MNRTDMIPLVLLTVNDQLRFWAKVDRRSENECWPWLGKPNNQGYGYFMYQRQTYIATRIMYFLHNAKDPNDLMVCHTCNNKMCVNPNHFYLGTSSENQQQAFDDGLSHRKGELNNRARLWEQDVLEIRRLASLGVSPKELSRRYPIRIRAIRSIIARETWRHI